jgi:hypothetical protein
MKLIRKGTFETNSSSCHSISVSTQGTYEGLTPDHRNEIILSPMEFGWEQEEYSDAMSKLSYLWVYIKGWSGDSKDSFMEMYQKVVCEHTGASSVRMGSGSCEYNLDGYIDHQSVEGNELHYLFENEQILKDFLFLPQSYIETDNDNY